MRILKFLLFVEFVGIVNNFIDDCFSVELNIDYFDMILGYSFFFKVVKFLNILKGGL